MKKLITLFVLILSTSALAQTQPEPTSKAIDSVTANRFETIKMMGRYVGFDAQTNQPVYNGTAGNFSEIFDASNFDKGDDCMMQQFAIVMNVLVKHPEFVNRLQITHIQIDNLYGTTSQLASHTLQVQLFNDPWLRVEAGVKNDVQYGDRQLYCILQSPQQILTALQTIAVNH